MYPTGKRSRSYDKGYHKPHTVEELTQRNVETILKLDETAKANRTKSDCIADAISNFHETRLSERRNQLDLQINLLAEQENTKMLTLLERIAKKVGARTDDDPHLQVLEQATQPEKLVDQIEETTKQNAQASGQK